VTLTDEDTAMPEPLPAPEQPKRRARELRGKFATVLGSIIFLLIVLPFFAIALYFVIYIGALVGVGLGSELWGRVGGIVCGVLCALAFVGAMFIPQRGDD
jgi:hypothetical protein